MREGRSHRSLLTEECRFGCGHVGRHGLAGHEGTLTLLGRVGQSAGRFLNAFAHVLGGRFDRFAHGVGHAFPSAQRLLLHLAGHFRRHQDHVLAESEVVRNGHERPAAAQVGEDAAADAVAGRLPALLVEVQVREAAQVVALGGGQHGADQLVVVREPWDVTGGHHGVRGADHHRVFADRMNPVVR